MKRKNKKNKSRRLFAVTGAGGRLKITTGGRVGGDGKNNPFPIFDDYNDIVSMIKDPAKGAEKIVTSVGDQLKKKLDSATKTNFTITFNPSDHTNDEEPIVPAYVFNGKTKQVLANVTDDRHVHKTAYHTGKKPSRAVLDAKRTAGSGYRVLTDSLVDVISAEDRNVITQQVGFNQKSYHVPPVRSQVPVYLVKDLIASDFTVPTETRSPRRMLSNVINIKQQFMIKNSSANFPMKFTIHLVKIKNQAYAPFNLNSLMFRSFYDTTDDLSDYSSSALKIGTIPKYLQHGQFAFEGSGKMQAGTVFVSNKLKSLNASSNFRSGAEIVESFSKTIPPGDFWNFSHTHHCGSGIDIMSIYRSTAAGEGEEPDTGFSLYTDQSDQPLTYGVIFECRGTTAEAYSVPSENVINTYIGSSPCAYSYEFKTSAYFAADELDTSNVTTPGFRVYEQDFAISDFGTVSDAREKFFFPTDLSTGVLAPTLANVGKAYVPMVTNSAVSTALFEGGQNPG